MKANPCVLVVTHRPEVMISEGVFKPISVNRDIDSPNWFSDHQGENIAEYNDRFCELTAMFWAWKNLPAAYTHVGLFHYRRGLATNFSLMQQWKERIKVKDINQVGKLIDDQSLKILLKQFDVLVPRLSKVNGSVAKHYQCRHIPEDWDVLMDVLADKLPSDQFHQAEEFFSGDKTMWANLFVAKREIFERYCEWLFPILFDTLEKIHVSEYPYQKRVIGFMAERLMSFYMLNLLGNDVRIKHVPAVHWI